MENIKFGIVWTWATGGLCVGPYRQSTFALLIFLDEENRLSRFSIPCGGIKANPTGGDMDWWVLRVKFAKRTGANIANACCTVYMHMYLS